jgi:hypothetical protein
VPAARRGGRKIEDAFLLYKPLVTSGFGGGEIRWVDERERE